MDGISGRLRATHEGILHYEVLEDNGVKEVIEDTGYLIPDLTHRLFSPQHYLRSKAIDTDNTEDMYFVVSYDKGLFKTESGNRFSVQYDPVMRHPVLEVQTNVTDGSKLGLVCLGSITDETNKNLTVLQKCLLKWHCILGHQGMTLVQWLGRQGFLDSTGDRWGETTVQIPKCSACLLEKM